MTATDITPVEDAGHAVSVVPDEDETWPLIPGKPDHKGRPTRMQPDLILLWISADGTVTARGSGIRVRRDGTLGDPGLRVDAPWRELGDLPEWAAEMTDGALVALRYRHLLEA